MEWISVKDKLPDKYGHLLGYSENYIAAPVLTSAVFICLYHKELGWLEATKGPNLDGFITHWMPLPEPPHNTGG